MNPFARREEMLPIPSTWAGSQARHATDTPRKKKKSKTASTNPGNPPAAPSIVELATKQGSVHPQHAAGSERHAVAPASEMLIDKIKENLRAARSFQREAKMYSLNLNTILSSTSYRSLMKQLSGGEGYILPGDESVAPTKREAVVPTITRAYEENFMREALPGERECARGNHCECRFIDPTMPFVCVEFLTLEELSSPPEERQLCVVCCRKETQYLFYDMLFNAAVYNATIQRFGNLSGEHEYANECLLRCTRSCDLVCMPKPIMSHQRNRYVVVRDAQRQCLVLQQVHVSPGDYVHTTPRQPDCKAFF